MEMTAQVINQCTTSLSHAAQGALLTLRALKQMVRRRTNKLGTSINLETLIIPEEFTTHVPHHGEISAPPLFCQIYVIFAEALGGVHSVLYALLLDKSRSTYDRLFDMMKGIVPEANPRSISCDFEMAAFNAIRTAFPVVRLHGYKNDSDFALQAKMVIALAFVPTDGLEQAIDSLAGHLPDELQPLLDWFEDRYVGLRNRRGDVRRPPMFPVEMWSMYSRDVDEDSRTNNYAGAAHRRLKAELGMAHLTIWKLIDSLRKVQHLVTGHQPPKKLKKYRDADERIVPIVRQYNNMDVITYLHGLAHNYD
ncbi:hypothetical protein T11_5756 [Trichinella zimbabwensis]|uniref:MULE transposase domain-containing protein n=1 Tax=Trichinella zimbabwensis TaxID=268475 RepID=A0A0V1H225_9BILA|nr:hypothetical protein T11_5756 [Trichinella zimbabwensis]